ncbi:MAG: oligosaccharide flippase family protein [Balneolales bacterium]
MRKEIIRFFKKPFLRDVAMVSAGTIAAQVITVVSSPILTRLFPPEDFGILAVFVSSSAILAVLYTLQYDMAVVLPKEDGDAKVLLGMAAKLALWFFAALSLLATIAFFIPFLKLTGFRDVPVYTPLLVVLGGFLIAMERSFSYWNVRQKSFQLISIALTVGALLSAMFKITTGFLAAGAWILIFGNLLSNFVNISMQIFYGKNGEVLKDSFKKLSDKMKSQSIFREYSDFPKYRMPQSLINTIGKNLPAILLVALFNPAIGGFYALAYRMINMPGSLISEAIRKVFYQKSAELRSKKSGFFSEMLKTTIWLAVGGLVPFGLLAVMSPYIFPFVFGDEWYTAGVYASYLTLWTYTAFCNTPATSVMPVLRQQRRYLIFNIVNLIARVAVLFFAALTGGPMEAIIYLSAAGMFYNIIIIIDVHIQAYRDQKLITQLKQ